MAQTRIREDPEGREAQALAELGGDLSAARVLEVGCGDGRMTWRYAHRARQVLAIDPDAAAIEAARRSMPDPLRGRVEFRCATVGDLAVEPRAFDVAVLAWSL